MGSDIEGPSIHAHRPGRCAHRLDGRECVRLRWNRAHWRNRPGHGEAAAAPFFAVFNLGITHESRIRQRPHEAVHGPARVRRAVAQGHGSWAASTGTSRRRSCTVPGIPRLVSAPRRARRAAVSGQLWNWNDCLAPSAMR